MSPASQVQAAGNYLNTFSLEEVLAPCPGCTSLSPAAPLTVTPVVLLPPRVDRRAARGRPGTSGAEAEHTLTAEDDRGMASTWRPSATHPELGSGAQAASKPPLQRLHLMGTLSPGGDCPTCGGEGAGLAACPYPQKQEQQGQLLRVGLLRCKPVTAATADMPFTKIQFLGFIVAQLSTVQQNPFVQNTVGFTKLLYSMKRPCEI